MTLPGSLGKCLMKFSGNIKSYSYVTIQVIVIRYNQHVK